MRKRLLMLSFIEGGAVMAAELCGARLLAPVFGGSLYVWATVMGVTLAALALGYFYGAFISIPGEGDRRLATVLGAAALSVLLMPAIARFFMPLISMLPFIPAVVLSTAMLIFPAVFLLGASSPLFISLQTAAGWSSGKASGMVYAVSTAGGIAATFLAGFLLIPFAGLQFTLLLFGGLLFIANLLLLRFSSKAYNIFFLLAIFSLAFAPEENGKVLMTADGIMGRLVVEDHPRGNDTHRVLKVNGIVQSEIRLSDRGSASEYVRLLDMLIPSVTNGRKALVLGLGGGCVAGLLRGKGYRTEAVEFDRRIIECARRYFFLDTAVRTHCEDARYFLNHCEDRFHTIVVDLFHAEDGPPYVLTMESLEHLKAVLGHNGLLVINWYGFIEGRLGSGTRVLCSTLRRSGFTVRIHPTSGAPEHRNLVIVASNGNRTPQRGIPDLEVAAGDAVNTDDQPVLERHNAEASKAWRSAYIRYYRGRITQ